MKKTVSLLLILTLFFTLTASSYANTDLVKPQSLDPADGSPISKTITVQYKPQTNMHVTLRYTDIYVKPGDHDKVSRAFRTNAWDTLKSGLGWSISGYFIDPLLAAVYSSLSTIAAFNVHKAADDIIAIGDTGKWSKITIIHSVDSYGHKTTTIGVVESSNRVELRAGQTIATYAYGWN